MSNGEYPHRLIFGRTPDQIKAMIDKFEKGEEPKAYSTIGGITYCCKVCDTHVGNENYAFLMKAHWLADATTVQFVGSDWIGVVKMTNEQAIEALEKQMPKRPFVGDANTDTYYCPCCMEEIKEFSWASIKRPVLIPNRPKRCYNCGQRLDWS